mmetsp:Transcript_58101/g.129715  ORF Transcript_58101/g.129715 Transcript_58101/m.129715 type:complete len:388 (+) Transcript_58101:52-1215(+)
MAPKVPKLVTKDLTPSWRRFRQQRRAASQSAGLPYPGSQPLLHDEEAGSARIDRSTLPPEWVDHAERADEEIKEIKEQIEKLLTAHERCLALAEESPERRCSEREVEAISGHVAGLIRICEQTIHQIRSIGRGKEGLLDDEFRRNMQRNLASQLQQLSKQTREAQKAFLLQLKGRTPPQASSDAFGGAGPPSSSSAAPVQMQQQLSELDEMEAIAAQRSSDIAQIASSVVELNRIFRDLAELVIDQGTILDRIDHNTEKIYQKSNEAKGQLHQAMKRKKEDDTRAWRCLLAWGSADLVLIIVLLIKYQLKYGLKNVLIVLVIAGLLITGCYFGLKQYKPKVLTEGPSYIERIIPEGYRPEELWKKIRPGPMNTAKMGVSAMRGGVAP